MTTTLPIEEDAILSLQEFIKQPLRVLRMAKVNLALYASSEETLLVLVDSLTEELETMQIELENILDDYNTDKKEDEIYKAKYGQTPQERLKELVPIGREGSKVFFAKWGPLTATKGVEQQ